MVLSERCSLTGLSSLVFIWLIEVRELRVTGFGLLWITWILTSECVWDVCAFRLCGGVLLMPGVLPMSSTIWAPHIFGLNLEDNPTGIDFVNPFIERRDGDVSRTFCRLRNIHLKHGKRGMETIGHWILVWQSNSQWDWGGEGFDRGFPSDSPCVFGLLAYPRRHYFCIELVDLYFWL